MGTARYALAGAGTQTAGLAFGGYVGPPGATGATEEYDGTSWSPGGSLNTGRYSCGSRNSNSWFSFWRNNRNWFCYNNRRI
jgi:hypothetical protein